MSVRQLAVVAAIGSVLWVMVIHAAAFVLLVVSSLGAQVAMAVRRRFGYRLPGH